MTPVDLVPSMGDPETTIALVLVFCLKLGIPWTFGRATRWRLKGPLPRLDKDFARFGHLSPESANAILVLSRHAGITLRALQTPVNVYK